MIPAGAGKIVNVTLSPHNGLPGMAHSAAARAAGHGPARAPTEEEFAWLVVAFVASPGGDYLSGSVLTIDGARDNRFGSSPPGGEVFAEERKP